MTDDAERSHVVADQSAVFALLGRPETYGGAGPVKRIDTHGAVVFLAGPDAYKVKRAVRFPFMDFSTLEKRRSACLAEVEINAPGAPGLYLGVIPVTRTAAGLSLGGDGVPVEWVLHMRRFDENRTLDLVADAGGLTEPMLRDLVAATLASHARAPLRDGAAAADSLGRYVAQNREAFAENGDLFPPERAADLCDRAEAELARVRPLLLARGAAGLVRRCHGDLHLRNVALIDGRPTLFDAVEFDEGIATCDVLYDLAFLVMDLVERGLVRQANLVLNRYLQAGDSANLQGLAAFPLFLSLRATIRAKVIAAALPSIPEAARIRARAEALRYFGVAEEALAPAPVVCVAIGGLSGSGKSTLGAAVAPMLGRVPGAVHLRSDVIRKRLAGVTETETLPAASYTSERSETVYAALRSQATAVLGTGTSVVVDAVHARPEERAAIAAVAAAADAAFAGFWLEAPVEVMAERVGRRIGDASDATPEVVRLQAEFDLGSMEWTRLDATQSAGTLAAAVTERIRRSR